MGRGLSVVGGAILFFVAILALVRFGPGWQIRAPVIAGAAAGITWLVYLERRRQKAQAKQAAADDEKRFTELSAQVDRPQFELAVTGTSNIVIAAGVVVFAGVISLWGYTAHLVVVMLLGLPLLGFSAFLLLRVIPALGKPVVTMSRNGFATPLTLQLPWKLVDGIHLETNRYHGQVISHVLVLRIKSLAEHIPGFVPIQRLSYWLAPKAGKERVAIVLKGTNEKPEVVYRLARLLWTKSTERDYDWNPNMSEEFNDALRKTKEAADRIQTEQETGLAPPRGPAELARVKKELESNSAMMEKEIRRKARTMKWVNVSIVVFVILYVVIRLMLKKTG